MFYSLWNNVSFCVSSVLRDRGYFGNVTIYWQLFANDTPLEPHQEFLNTSGSIVFHTGEKIKPIVLEAISDKLPEFNEFYELRLMNISGKANISISQGPMKVLFSGRMDQQFWNMYIVVQSNALYTENAPSHYITCNQLSIKLFFNK